MYHDDYTLPYLVISLVYDLIMTIFLPVRVCVLLSQLTTATLVPVALSFVRSNTSYCAPMNNLAISWNNHAQVVDTIALQDLSASVSHRVTTLGYRMCVFTVALENNPPSLVCSTAAKRGTTITKHAGATADRTGDAGEHTLTVGNRLASDRAGPRHTNCTARGRRSWDRTAARWEKSAPSCGVRMDSGSMNLMVRWGRKYKCHGTVGSA